MNKNWSAIVAFFLLVGIMGSAFASEYSDVRSSIPTNERTTLPFTIAASSSACKTNCRNKKNACKAKCVGRGSFGNCIGSCMSSYSACLAGC